MDRTVSNIDTFLVTAISGICQILGCTGNLRWKI